MSIILQDGSGFLWTVTVDDTTGRLITTLGPAGSTSNVFLNDSLGFSWQVGITTGGLLTTKKVTLNPAYPEKIIFDSNFSLAITFLGILQTVPTSPALDIEPVTGTPFEIPLQPTPQTLTIVLAGVQYQLLIYWNNMSQNWMLDISDASGSPIVQGIALVTGLDLLEQFGYLDFGGKLIAQTDNNPGAVPTFKNLGITGHLYFVVGP